MPIETVPCISCVKKFPIWKRSNILPNLTGATRQYTWAYAVPNLFHLIVSQIIIVQLISPNLLSLTAQYELNDIIFLIICSISGCANFNIHYYAASTKGSILTTVKLNSL